MIALRFLNDIAKPWDELNVLLAERLALQPDLSDITRIAGSLAVAIRHQVDTAEISDTLANEESNEHRIISDTADFWKHGPLRKPERNNKLSTESHFEYDSEKGFSFIRNVLYIEHSTLGQHDFLVTSLAAIRYWIQKREISTNWLGLVKENAPEFHSIAFLNFDPKRCILMNQTRLKFFSKRVDGFWESVNPSEVRIEIR